MKDITHLSCSDIFPKGFTPRENQVQCIDKTLDYFRTGGKFVIINAPTGSGKSLIGAAFAELVDPPTEDYKTAVLSHAIYDTVNGPDFTGVHSGCFVLTTTKTLQDQYSDTFEYGYTLKGKTNYQCTENPEVAVDFGPCVLTPKVRRGCWARNSCPYYTARDNILINKISFLNYSAFFHLQDNAKYRNIIVCDEASEIEDELVKAYSVTITYKHLDILNIKYNKLEDDSKAQGWLTDIYGSVKNTCKELMEQFANKINLTQKDTIRLRYANQLSQSIEKVLDHWSTVEYIIEKDDKTVQAIPLKVDYLSQNLFNYTERVILMSATIIDHANYAKSLGIKDYKYIEVDSTFSPKKSPIYCSDKFPLSYKTMERNLPKVIDMAVAIADKHKNEKGIIHTYTFVITQKLKQKLYGKRFLYREDGSTNEDILAEHGLRSDPTVLISPSMAFGVDLKDDAARWQIIMKMPYSSLASKRIKKLAELDPKWYTRKMLTSFVQMCGRSTRSEDDHSVTYVLDGSIISIMQRCRDLLPKYFLQRFM